MKLLPNVSILILLQLFTIFIQSDSAKDVGYIDDDINTNWSCYTPILEPNLVYPQNLTEVKLTITFIISKCGRNPVSLISSPCLDVNFMGQDIKYRKLDKCPLIYKNRQCLLRITYSDVVYVPVINPTGIDVWTNGMNISIILWNCHLNQSLFTETVIKAVEETLSATAAEAEIYPKASMVDFPATVAKTPIIKNNGYYYWIIPLFICIFVCTFGFKKPKRKGNRLVVVESNLRTIR